MIRRKLAAATVAVLVLLGLAGCWDVREMNALALVMAVGIDKAETPGRFLVTVQIARPSVAVQGKGGGGQAGGGAVYTASADGDTIFAAIRNLAQFTSRRIMWAHNNVVVIGEELAREDITPVVDFFTRNQELRMRTWVVVARGTDARSIVAAKTGMEDIPANSISALFRYAQLPGETVISDMGRVAAEFLGADVNPAIAAIRLTPRVVPAQDKQGEHGGGLQAELRGSAIFRRNRLVGYVDAEAGRGLLWLRGEMKNAVLSISCPPGKPGKMAVEVRSPNANLSVQFAGSQPTFLLEVQTEGWLSEQDCLLPQMSILELKAYAERELARHIDEEIRAALRLLQNELKADTAGFGRRVHVQYPAWWRANRERWDEIFPKVKVRTEITAAIPKMGLFTRPMTMHH